MEKYIQIRSTPGPAFSEAPPGGGVIETTGGTQPEPPSRPCQHVSFWEATTNNFETTNNFLGISAAVEKGIGFTSKAVGIVKGIVSDGPIVGGGAAGLDISGEAIISAHLGPAAGAFWSGGSAFAEAGTSTATVGDLGATISGAFAEGGSVAIGGAGLEVAGFATAGIAAFEVGNAIGSAFVGAFKSLTDDCP